MKRYDKAFKEEAVRLSDEIGVKKAAEQLGVFYIRCRNGESEEPCMVTAHILAADEPTQTLARLHVKKS